MTYVFIGLVILLALAVVVFLRAWEDVTARRRCGLDEDYQSYLGGLRRVTRRSRR